MRLYRGIWHSALTHSNGGERKTEHDASQRREVDAPSPEEGVHDVVQDRNGHHLNNCVKPRQKIVGCTVGKVSNGRVLEEGRRIYPSVVIPAAMLMKSVLRPVSQMM